MGIAAACHIPFRNSHPLLYMVTYHQLLLKKFQPYLSCDQYFSPLLCTSTKGSHLPNRTVLPWQEQLTS